MLQKNHRGDLYITIYSKRYFSNASRVNLDS